MLVHVSQPRTEGFRIEGNVPKPLMDYVYSQFGKNNVSLYNDYNDYEEELVDPFEEDWFKEIEASQTPGSELKFYRKLCKMTQPQLAAMVGTTKNAISAMEHDARPISKKMAKQFAAIFHTSPARFI